MQKNIKKAAAISYDPTQNEAPIISALGVGTIAENIIKIATENNVPVVEDKSIADLLSALSVGDIIPLELYEVVAQILVFLAESNSEYRNKFLK